jgi:hypothetical protein
MSYCLSTCAALYLLSRSHPVTVITNTPAWFYPVNESAVHGDEERRSHFAAYLYLTVVFLMTLCVLLYCR